jgi:hypothetical protein
MSAYANIGKSKEGEERCLSAFSFFYHALTKNYTKHIKQANLCNDVKDKSVGKKHGDACNSCKPAISERVSPASTLYPIGFSVFGGCSGKEPVQSGRN